MATAKGPMWSRPDAPRPNRNTVDVLAPVTYGRAGLVRAPLRDWCRDHGRAVAVVAGAGWSCGRPMLEVVDVLYQTRNGGPWEPTKCPTCRGVIGWVHAEWVVDGGLIHLRIAGNEKPPGGSGGGGDDVRAVASC